MDIQKRNSYWRSLKKEYRSYRDAVNDHSPEGFQEWMNDNWGVKIGIVDGGYADTYSIVDEKKYLMWAIKVGIQT